MTGFSNALRGAFMAPFCAVILASAAGLPGAEPACLPVALFNAPQGLAADGNGSLFLADAGNHLIRRISADGMVKTIAGTALKPGGRDGTAAEALFNTPTGLTVSADGSVIVADSGNCTIRKISPAGGVTTLAGTAGKCGYADGAAGQSRFNSPRAVAAGGDGVVFVADWGNALIRRIAADGTVSTFAGRCEGACQGAFADGPASTARFGPVTGITVDDRGRLIIADPSNGRIRMVAAGRCGDAGAEGQCVTTIAGGPGCGLVDGSAEAARFCNFEGIAMGDDGYLYVADTGNRAIRKVRLRSGEVTTVSGRAGTACGSADGALSAARFCSPKSLASGGKGRVIVSDSGTQLLRRITAGDRVELFAGVSGKSGSRDGVAPAAFVVPKPASRAAICNPSPPVIRPRGAVEGAVSY